MINITNIENELYGWLSQIDSKCIIANPNAPRPSDTLYSTIHVMGSFPQGVAETIMTFKAIDYSADAQHSDVEEVMVSINTFYEGSFQLASQLKDSFVKLSAYDYFSSNGLLGYLRSSDVRDLTVEVNKRMEERAQFDCFFTTRSLETENIETIRKIELTNELDDTTFEVVHPDGSP